MVFESLLKYPAALMIGFIAATLAVPSVIRLARSIGAVDQPSDRRINRDPVPRLGGLAVFFGFHLTCAAIFAVFPAVTAFDLRPGVAWWGSIILGSSLILAIGVLDDVIGLRWWSKLIGQIVVGVMMFTAGIRFYSICGVAVDPTLDLFLSVGWFVAAMNAMNLIDGLDGLAAGLAVIASCGLALVALLGGQVVLTLVLVGLCGSCLGFLRHNFHPARIFLGDSGSMFLGFIIAAIGLVSGARSTTALALLTPVVSIGVPIFDACLAVWRRSVRVFAGTPSTGGLARPDLDHLHHRLLRSGLTQKQVAIALYALNSALVLAAVSALAFSSYASGILALAFVTGSYVVVQHLARIELWDSGDRIMRGLRAPHRSSVYPMLYPIVDSIVILIAIAFATALTVPGSEFGALRAEVARQIPVFGGTVFLGICWSSAYSRVWSRGRVSEFVGLGAVVFFSSILAGAIACFISATGEFPGVRTFLFGLLAAVGVTGVRSLPRVVQDFFTFADQATIRPEHGPSIPTLVYGAGDRGLLFLKDCALGNRPNLRIVGFIDDDLGLRRRYVHGVRVLGVLSELADVVEVTGARKVVVATAVDAAAARHLQAIAATRSLSIVLWSAHLAPFDGEADNSERPVPTPRSIAA